VGGDAAGATLVRSTLPVVYAVVAPAPRKVREGRGTRGCGGFCSLKAGPPAFYDFVVFTEKKRVEKLRYMHRNPVQRGLVLRPEDWLWSSFRHYAYGERGPVLVNGTQKAELHIRKIS
jgi:hypothetical protein